MHISVSCLIPKYIMQSCQNTSHAASTNQRDYATGGFSWPRNRNTINSTPLTTKKGKILQQGELNLARLLIGGKLSLKFRLKYSESYKMIGHLSGG
jgi:hypothetical protein